MSVVCVLPSPSHPHPTPSQRDSDSSSSSSDDSDSDPDSESSSESDSGKRAAKQLRKDKEQRNKRQKPMPAASKGSGGGSGSSTEKKEESTEEFEVEEILDRKRVGELVSSGLLRRSELYRKEEPDDAFRYLIKWKGYESSSNSWEPPRNLVSCDEFKENFLEKRKETHPDEFI